MTNALKLPQTPRERIANILSDVFSPPVVWGVMAIPLAARGAGSLVAGLPWAFVYIVFVCVLPALYIVVQVARGAITDLHVRVRQQRLRPFLLSIGCSLAAWVLLSLLRAPDLIAQFALMTGIITGAMFIITIWWQISMHAMSITTAVVVLGGLFGAGVALIAAPLIPIVSLARVILRRHTVPQVIAGGLLGAAMTLILVLLLGIVF